VVSALEGRLRALDHSATPQERAIFEHKIVLLRRIILWTDVVVFPVIGYTFGRIIGG
jgi:hypothetical protein